jgi:hypothetical protein
MRSPSSLLWRSDPSVLDLAMLTGTTWLTRAVFGPFQWARLLQSKRITMKTHFALSMSALLAVSSFRCGGRASSADDTGSSLGGGSAGNNSTVSCNSPVSDGGASSLADGQAPLEHRASPCCSSQRGPGTSGQPYSDGFAAEIDGHVACRSDSDCNAGPNGRCFPFEGLVGPGGCSYDECATDSDCASGRPCVCRNAPSANDANVCAPLGNCAVDSDCGPGGYCSPSAASCDFPNPYFCHTALDRCTNDADCSLMNAVDPVAARAVCAYDPQALHWACTQLVCYPP